jgi:hypothetical protein
MHSDINRLSENLEAAVFDDTECDLIAVFFGIAVGAMLPAPRIMRFVPVEGLPGSLTGDTSK